MSQLSDRLAQAAQAINQAMATLVADCGRIEDSLNAAADARAQQAIATALANGQELIASIKQQTTGQIALIQQDANALIAAVEAEYKAKLADAKTAKVAK